MHYIKYSKCFGLRDGAVLPGIAATFCLLTMPIGAFAQNDPYHANFTYQELAVNCNTVRGVRAKQLCAGINKLVPPTLQYCKRAKRSIEISTCNQSLRNILRARKNLLKQQGLQQGNNHSNSPTKKESSIRPSPTRGHRNLSSKATFSIFGVPIGQPLSECPTYLRDKGSSIDESYVSPIKAGPCYTHSFLKKVKTGKKKRIIRAVAPVIDIRAVDRRTSRSVRWNKGQEPTLPHGQTVHAAGGIWIGSSLEGMTIRFSDRRAIDAEKSRQIRANLRQMIEGKFGPPTGKKTKSLSGKNVTHKAEVYFWDLPHVKIKLDPLADISYGDGYRDEAVRYINLHGRITIDTPQGAQQRAKLRESKPLKVPF